MLLDAWHVSFTVSDLEKSIAFYRDIVGMTLEVSPKELKGQMLSEVTKNPGAHLKVAILKLGSFRLELIQYISPRGKTYRPTLADVGSAHIAFSVDSVEEEYQRLKAVGVEFLSKPGQSRPDGLPLVFLFDPDGYALELNERPGGAGAWVVREEND